MVCSHCGGDIPASSDLCPHCGVAPHDVAAEGTNTPPPDSPVTQVSGGTVIDVGHTLPGWPGAASPAPDEPSPAPRPPAPPGTGPLTPGESFGRRYHLIRLLGIGGMGAVYQAWDAELGVSVAIKVIRPEVMANRAAAEEISKRFKRELLLARQVTHKNVVRIHDLGEIDGIKYITMPYVDGADLATILKHEGKVSVPRALRVARSIVSGLTAAHGAGVVHRDLKPANIMIGADGEGMIMDFGIARSTGGGNAEPQEGGGSPAAPHGPEAQPSDATVMGAVIGTLEYMAPEQARGESVDQRADVYAFGLILYEMLVGRRRKVEGGAFSELQARLKQPPASARSLVPEIPEALDRLVTRCLEPDPAARFQTSDELFADLDRLDENGEPIPIKRTLGLPVVAAVVAALLALMGGVWWYTRQLLPPEPHDPVSVLIADFQNGTNDPAFERTIEPMLKRGLEDAGFITAYDRSAVSRTRGVRPPETMDEVAARELAVQQGLGVVLSGSIASQDSGYAVSIKATETVTGNVVADATERASGKDQVMAAATNLVATVRTALGDETSESTQMFAMASLSATSLDVVRYYAAAQEAASNNKFEEARQNALKAVELDPTFGVGYQLLAVASRNVGRVAEAEKYIKEALRYLDGMTERERYSTRGMSYRVTGDYEACVKEYGELIARYAGDVTGRNQLALCSSQLRDLSRAVSEMREVVELLPKRAVFRVNLALYANYAGEFQTGEEEARAVEQPGAYSLLALAFAQLGQGQRPMAMETYERVGTFGTLGASFAASGLGDLALLEGRFSDAVRIYKQGVAADLAAGNPNRAAAKQAALAYIHLLRGQEGPAVALAREALANSHEAKIRFLAARTFVAADQPDEARELMTGLASELQAEPQAYAKIVEGEIALKNKDLRQAVALLNQANALLDTWIGHFALGRAYLEAGQTLQADSEFDRCLKRRGEALALFLDEEPTYGYFPAVYYYQGRVREGLGTAGFAESYRAYLEIRGRSGEDPLVAEVRQRMIATP